MCGRMYLSDPKGFIGRNGWAVGLPTQGELFEEVQRPRYNIAPLQQLLAIRNDGDRPIFDSMRWGLVPSWSRTDEHAAKLINARSETVGEKPSFRDALARRRCLIVADGFYEWQKLTGPGNQTQPHAVAGESGAPLTFAGLWESWVDPTTRRPLLTATVCTRAADAQIAHLHHRMAVVVPKDQWSTWLDPAASAQTAAEILLAVPAPTFKTWPVSKRVGAVRNDDASLLDPVELGPESLFD
ncbi:MAG: SOS response-associated peptidase [Planctomycetota bacterium]